MKVENISKDLISIDLEITLAEKLYQSINNETRRVSSATIDFASLLEEAVYSSRDNFRQPPHAFDQKHPPHPISEEG